MTKKQTQAYTEEFRKEAVRRAEQKGNTAASVGRELGISAQQIYNCPLWQPGVRSDCYN